MPAEVKIPISTIKDARVRTVYAPRENACRYLQLSILNKKVFFLRFFLGSFFCFFFLCDFFLFANCLIRFRHFPFGSRVSPWSNLDHGKTLLVRPRINRGLASPYLHLEMMSALQDFTICITVNIGNKGAQPKIETILRIGNY